MLQNASGHTQKRSDRELVMGDHRMDVAVKEIEGKR